MNASQVLLLLIDTELDSSLLIPRLGQELSNEDNRADRGCVASWGPDHLAGNGADFLLVLSSRTLEEPMHEAKQMTMA
jgi:hypothetical protein